MSSDGSFPWFRLYASEFQSQTSGLKAIEKGVYITLLVAMHEHDGPIPADMQRLARRAGTTGRAFKLALEALLDSGLIFEAEAGLAAPSAQREAENRALKSKNAQQNATVRWKKTKQKQRSKNAEAYKSQSQIPESEPQALKEPVATDQTDTVPDDKNNRVLSKGTARASAVPISINIDDEIYIPSVGCGWIESIISSRPPVSIVTVQVDDQGHGAHYRCTHRHDGTVDAVEITVDEADKYLPKMQSGGSSNAA